MLVLNSCPTFLPEVFSTFWLDLTLNQRPQRNNLWYGSQTHYQVSQKQGFWLSCQHVFEVSGSEVYVQRRAPLAGLRNTRAPKPHFPSGSRHYCSRGSFCVARSSLEPATSRLSLQSELFEVSGSEVLHQAFWLPLFHVHGNHGNQGIEEMNYCKFYNRIS